MKNKYELCWIYKYKWCKCIYEVPIEVIDITFNKSYMFLIRDTSTGEVWFTGTVYEPNSN